MTTLSLPEAIQAAQNLYETGKLQDAVVMCNTILYYVPTCQEAKDILAAIPTEVYSQDFYKHHADGSRQTATAFFSHLFSFYRPSSMIDFGAGAGNWLLAAQDLGIEELYAVEGEWVRDQVSSLNIHYIFHDLQTSYRTDRRFDLAVSLEVAEHLDEQRADSFIGDLCHASNLVMFGAAMKHQGGRGHINEQNQSYWIKRFRVRNYECLDIFRTPFWFRQDLEFWYVQNTFLFLKKGDPRRDLFVNDPLYDVHHPRLLNDANLRLYGNG